MVNLNIPIPQDLHRKLKLEAVTKGKTLKDHFLDILEEEIGHG